MARVRPSAEPLKVFCAQLRDLRVEAGNPTLRAVRELMPCNPGISTLSDVLNAKINSAPDWRLVAEFVTACVSFARSAQPARVLSGLSADLRLWQRRHADLQVRLEVLNSHGRQVESTAAPTNLIRDVWAFTGRDHELRHLVDAVGRASGEVLALHGMAGVGKTALAVRTAHQVADRFPDGRLFLDLHAHTTGQQPVTPEDAVEALLRAIGLPPGDMPDTLDARAALWRSKVVDKRMLILLDDAARHDQVRPLLPGAAGCCVLITSRRRLSALEGVIPMALDVLPPDEAAELFIRLAGLTEADSESVDRLVRLAGRLPLAIRLLAGKLRHRPSWTVDILVNELAAARDRSAAITAEDVAVSASFELSYAELDQSAQALFREIGLHPGVDFDVAGVAALTGADPETVRRDLDTLYDNHLVDEPMPGRFRLHDLIRDYARAMAHTESGRTEAEAIGRLTEYYTAATSVAVAVSTGSAEPGEQSEFSTQDSARSWLEAELANLCAVVERSASFDVSAAVRLNHALCDYLRNRGHWNRAVALCQTVREASARSDDRGVEAHALRDLAAAHRMLGHYPKVRESLDRARVLFDETGDAEEAAETLLRLGVVGRSTGDYVGARSEIEAALRGFRELDNPVSTALAINELGYLHRLTGAYRDAETMLAEAVRMHSQYGHHVRQAGALRELGYAQFALGDEAAAVDSLTQSLALSRKTGSRAWEIDALNGLGKLRRLTGELDAAHALHSQALAMAQELGYPQGCTTAFNHLGLLERADAPAVAAARHEEALALAVATTNRHGQADSLQGLGWCRIDLGDRVTGLHNLREALQIYREIGVPEATELARRMSALRN